MSDTAQTEERLKAIRKGRPHAGAGLRAMMAHQAWVWRNSGLVLGLMLAVLIAAMTLSPLPSSVHGTTGIDKVYHFIAFTALIFPLILTDSRRWRWAVPLCVFYGGFIELIQPTFGRSAEWLDFGADVTGVLAGAALAELLHDRIRARFFAVEGSESDAEDDEAEARRMEAMRSELMDELRVVLREELTHLQSETPDAGTAQHGAAQHGTGVAHPRPSLAHPHAAGVEPVHPVSRIQTVAQARAARRL